MGGGLNPTSPEGAYRLNDSYQLNGRIDTTVFHHKRLSNILGIHIIMLNHM